MYNIVVILAGGTGSRVGGETPKQFLPLKDERSILEHSVSAFEQAPCIDEIVIVMHPDWIKEAQTMLQRNEWQKVKAIIPGGNERWESSWQAIKAVSRQQSTISYQQSVINLWFHDAARPFVSQRILADISQALESYEAVTVAVPSTDTLYRVDSRDSRVESIPDRKEFMRAQTPQAFRMEIIRKAFENALERGNIGVTDDVGIVHRFMPEVPIYIVAGEEENRKITFIEDLK